MLRIKVCGFTRVVDLRSALDAGIDAFGFNLAHGPRRLAPDHARELIHLVPPFAASIGLFVDADEEAILTAVQATRCTVVQLHGDEPPELADALRRRLPVIKAFRIATADDLDRIAGYPADAYLLDTAVPGMHGGTGTAWDHAWFAGRDLGKPIILAGGLRPDTVAAAVAAVHPYGVDTASGVESAPGVKDPALLRAFVAACR